MHAHSYLENFHFQTDGWMSVRSSRAYEYQTETLFQGAQDAMQRAALAPLGRYMAGRAPEAMTLLEVAAGTVRACCQHRQASLLAPALRCTARRPPRHRRSAELRARRAPRRSLRPRACHTQGRFHTFIKDNYPSMATTCSELSPYYLAEARENIEYFAEFDAKAHPGRQLARTTFVQAAAEALPFPDASFDVLMNVYLFHELPAAARAAAAAEFGRVTRPGGIAIINDSLQRGDRADMDKLLHKFPEAYHEPHYMSYVDEDMTALFDAAGFDLVSIELAHVSKVWAFQRR